MISQAFADERVCPDDLTREALDVWPKALTEPLFVYFIQAEHGGPVKIGQAQDPRARLRELQCGNPDRLVIRSVILAEQETERSLHVAWASARVRGEWFGGGMEEAIVAFAQQACRNQLEAAERGEGGFSIARHAKWEIAYPEADDEEIWT